MALIQRPRISGKKCCSVGGGGAQHAALRVHIRIEYNLAFLYTHPFDKGDNSGVLGFERLGIVSCERATRYFFWRTHHYRGVSLSHCRKFVFVFFVQRRKLRAASAASCGSFIDRNGRSCM